MPPDLTPFLSRPIAHRGLHDRINGRIENSLSAVGAAVDYGYGVEIDVQLSRDGEAVVFHDHELDRLTRARGRVADRTAAEICKLSLIGAESGEGPPTLRAVLERVAGAVALLIEIKDQDGALGAKVGALEKCVADALTGYHGPVAVQSFNPWSMGWFAENAPQWPRGQISYRFSHASDAHIPPDHRSRLATLGYNNVSKPHFIAYGVMSMPCRAAIEARKSGLPLLAWTVRGAMERWLASTYADNVIFEGYRPPLARFAPPPRERAPNSERLPNSERP